ncbi:cytochrome P450 [Syncephalis fuscata]|nr:cytochrome P450 [Syncephalis fuscata]
MATNSLFPLYDSLYYIIFDWKLVVVTCVAYLFSRIIYNELFSPIAKIPGIRPAIIAQIISLYHMATGNFTSYTIAMTRRYGKIYRLGPKSVGTTDLDALRQIYSSTRFRKPESYKNFAFHRDSIFSTRDTTFHRKLKQLIGPVFSNTSINELEPLIYSAGATALANRVAEYAKTNKIFDIMELIHFATFAKVAFGGSFKTLQAIPGKKAHPIFHWINDMTYLGLLKNVLGRLCHPWIMPRYFESERLLIEFTRSVVCNRIAETDRYSASKDDRVKDVLQRLLESVDPKTGETLDVDQIIAESIIQLLGGTDTTSLTITWTLYLLDRELVAAIPNTNQDITHASIKNLPYLNAVLLESMRLRSVGGASQRAIPPGGAVICGIHLPEGFIVHPISSAIHLTPEIFGANPGQFCPDRWLDATPEQLKVMRQNILTFSLGTRACIGQSLAWMELRLIVAILMRRFVMTIPPEARTDMKPVRLFSLKPRGGCLKIQAAHRSE